ncbi:winged helix-turn-helix domain-containing protein [Shewanella halifaxensis]|uniref:winged helix-turn-helix domain-containing protein n=1 Tax=Shewanella halifaxensis TaxID=271098 RepID=UPI000D59DE11|nr:winged helix-turn-helix domain-containing protein [Shewanella halifaxensis]
MPQIDFQQQDFSQVYCAENFKICCRERVVYFAEHKVEVRPKTLALMQYLIESKRDICTKAELLEVIWDDVHCDEQVLFQTISEIRRIFAPQKVIQTFPRKGYRWCVNVTHQALEPSAVHADIGGATTSDSSLSNDISHPGYGHASLDTNKYPLAVELVLQHYKLLLSLLGIITLCYFLLFNTTTFDKQRAGATGTVIILPVSNQVIGRDHAWVPLGAMDQLIGNLNNRGKVMSTEYVLPLVANLSLTANYSRNHIATIFKRTGANLVVETELNGNVRDYQLSYRLHVKQGETVGVVFSASLDDALLQLAAIINRHIGASAAEIRADFQSELKNELVFQAIVLYKQGKLNAAQAMLRSTLAIEPDNHSVRLLLAQWLMLAGKELQGRELLFEQTNLLQPTSDLSGRYAYWLAYSYSQENFGATLKALEQSIKQSQVDNDFLYLGYAYQLKAALYSDLAQQANINLAVAEDSLKQALAFHQMIFCPMGVSQVKLALASLYQQQGKHELSLSYLEAAKKQIRLHELSIKI